MSKTKVTYVVTAPFFLVDKRGNHKPVKVGHKFTAAQFATLTDAKQAKCEKVTENVGRVRFNGGHVTDLPVVDGSVKSHFSNGEYDQLPVEVHNLVNEVAALWESDLGFEFPGICLGTDTHDGSLTWYIDNGNLPANLPPMIASNGSPTQLLPKRDRARGGYQFAPASLIKTAQKLRAGKPVFCSVEVAIDKLLAA